MKIDLAKMYFKFFLFLIYIQDMGKVIGVFSEGDLNNKFSVLSCSKKAEFGPVLTPVGEGGREHGGGV